MVTGGDGRRKLFHVDRVDTTGSRARWLGRAVKAGRESGHPWGDDSESFHCRVQRIV